MQVAFARKVLSSVLARKIHRGCGWHRSGGQHTASGALRQRADRTGIFFVNTIPEFEGMPPIVVSLDSS